MDFGVNNGSDNDVLPSSNKPLPEPMLTGDYQQQSLYKFAETDLRPQFIKLYFQMFLNIFRGTMG